MIFWRKFYPPDRTPVPRFAIPTAKYAVNEPEAWNCCPLWLKAELQKSSEEILHTTVFKSAERRQSKTHRSHVWAGSIPEGVFYRLNDNVYVASPEFAFCAAASDLSLHKAIAFGDELCGRYSFDADAERGFRKREAPLTSVERIGEFLERARGVRGKQKAERVLRFIVNQSASPMETFDEMGFSLPYHLGGYGIATPVMNEEIPLGSKAAHIARRATVYADMCWSDCHLDVEHHGVYDHSKTVDQASDRARVNAMKEEGFEVIELTKDQVNDLYSFEYIAMRIARITGKRLDKSKLGATSGRLKLRREVFEWNRSYGRIR